MIEDLRFKNAQLRHAVMHAAQNDAALMAAAYEIAMKQPTNASLDQVQANLQERARAMIKLRPDLEADFKGLL